MKPIEIRVTLTGRSLFLPALLVPLALAASPLDVPNSFSNGVPTDASTMNANFAAVESAVDDNDNRIQALEASVAALQSAGPVFLDSTVAITSGLVGNVDWTTADISAHSGADTARFAILRVAIPGVSNTSSYTNNEINFRATGQVSTQVTARWRVVNATASIVGGGFDGQYIVPLDGSERFDYRKVDTTAGSSNAVVFLEGYIL